MNLDYVAGCHDLRCATVTPSPPGPSGCSDDVTNG